MCVKTDKTEICFIVGDPNYVWNFSTLNKDGPDNNRFHQFQSQGGSLACFSDVFLRLASAMTTADLLMAHFSAFLIHVLVHTSI